MQIFAAYVQFKHANQSLQKLANQSMLDGALVIEIVNNSFSKSQEHFRPLIMRGTC